MVFCQSLLGKNRGYFKIADFLAGAHFLMRHPIFTLIEDHGSNGWVKAQFTVQGSLIKIRQTRLLL